MSNPFDAYERCPEHGCPVMRVTADAAPVCLLDWLAERYLNRQVVDVVPRSDAYGDLVLENGAVLPVKRLWSRNPRRLKPLWNHPREGVRLLALSSLRLADFGYLSKFDRLLLKFAVADVRGVFAFGEADLAGLLSLLEDEEVRKYEP